MADARTFLRQLADELAARKTFDAGARFAQWRSAIAGWRCEWEAFVALDDAPSSSPLRPETVISDLQRILPPETILSLDSGQHHNWFMQFWKAKYPQTMLNSWGFSAMGFGVCGVLGAALAAPHRPNVAVVGDGGFTMAPHVLCTAVEYNIPAIWIVWNNFAWGAIRDLQHGLFDGREIGTAFHHGTNRESYNPDFAAMARSCGVEGITVKHADELGTAVEHALRLGKPRLLDVHVDANVRPPSTGTWQLPPLQYREPVFGSRVLL